MRVQVLEDDRRLPQFRSPCSEYINASGALAASSTTVGGVRFDWEDLVAASWTNSGVRPPERQTSASAVMELRRLSGLNWDQLAVLFGVDRRSVHFWASGKPLSRENEERLYDVLAVVRRIDRGSAAENRALLLAQQPDGARPYDLLAEGKIDTVVAALERQSAPRRMDAARSRFRRGTSSPRRPLPPEILAGALQDGEHISKGEGRLLSATPIKTK